MLNNKNNTSTNQEYFCVTLFFNKIYKHMLLRTINNVETFM